MGLIIQKFGGTSLADQTGRERVIEKIKQGIKGHNQVVVVVSAMGRSGAPYATDTLLSLLEQPAGIRADERELDLLISCGEIISTVVLSNMLKGAGIASMALTGGQAGVQTTSHFMNAQVQAVSTEKLKSLLAQGLVPVVAGFQGRDEAGEVTTLGRGGSDTSAALLGEALQADCVEIYTDVDGIMTADPRIYDKARIIADISYDEVFQMADGGAKVIHPRAVEVVRRSSIPMVIRNTFSEEKGTQIATSTYQIDRPISIGDKVITSVAHRDGRIQFAVEGTINDEAFFQELARKGVSIDMINIFPGRRVFTVESEKKSDTVAIINGYGAKYHLVEACSKITVVGEKMTGVPGVMAKIISSLAKVDVKILQTSDSLATIACLVKTKDLNKAVHALHEAFLV